ncbi:hypothetical protein BRADI_4g11121v3 [Brachypodium distachyon]|uniref:Uncharacterized protein n=1 Tax=Brachypodium distachyon TaxID=15368 RepID=A0A2K2CM15_BRADI|nr:hypothetical protein BRADI_4g11121v3 [Brachypodium distachyon]
MRIDQLAKIYRMINYILPDLLSWHGKLKPQ